MTHIDSVRLRFLEYEQVGMSFDLPGAMYNLSATIFAAFLVSEFP